KTFTGNITVNNGTLSVANDVGDSAPSTSTLGNCQTAGRTITVNYPGTLNFASGDVLGGYAGGATVIGTLPSIVVNSGGVLNNTGGYNQIGNVVLNGATMSSTESAAGGGYGSFQFLGTI